MENWKSAKAAVLMRRNLYRDDVPTVKMAYESLELSHVWFSATLSQSKKFNLWSFNESQENEPVDQPAVGSWFSADVSGEIML